MQEYMQKEQRITEKKLCAIIGGGIAGIISAKLAIERGLDVIVFEKNSELKGLWSELGYTWPGMYLNISKYNNSFMDYIWSDTDKIFPTKEDFQNYLESFIKKYRIEKNVRLNSQVVNVSLSNNQDNKILVKFKVRDNEGEEIFFQQIFDYVIAATGKYSKPNCIGLEDFKDKIEIIHSSEYKKPEYFRNKNVLVVGCSHSGCQIAAEICRSAKSVTNIFRKPHWIIPYYLYSVKYNKLLPYDLILFGNRQNLMKLFNSLSDLPESQKNKIKNNYFSKFSTQNLNISDLNIDQNSEDYPYITISENYLRYVEEGLIIPIKGDIIGINPDDKTVSIRRNNTEELKTKEVDTIILCTGYTYDTSILDNSILNIIKVNDKTNSIIYKQDLNLDIFNVFNSKIKNLAFVGMGYGILLLTYQFQATLALNYFLDKNLNLEAIPKNIKFSQNEIIPYLDILATYSGYSPETQKIKENDIILYEMIMEGPIIPQHYGLYEYESNLYKKCADYIKRFNEDLNKSF